MTGHPSFRKAVATMSGTNPTTSDDQTASSEPRVAEQETELATHPAGTESATDEKSATLTDKASDAVTTVASSATAAATGVKDSVFSMFGGGEKKETKVEDEGAANDRSGSAKAQKEKEDDEVCHDPWVLSHHGARTTTVHETLLTTFSITGRQSRRGGGRCPLRARRTPHSDR